MFWLIQNNIYREEGQEKLLQLLKDRAIPHLEVKVVPFGDKLLPSTFNSHEYQGTLEELPELTIEKNQPIMVLGGTSLTRIAAKNKWSPGSFLNKNFHYEVWKKAYGNHLLNSGAIVDTFRNIQPTWDTFFIRPCEDTKDFAGSVYTKEAFDSWRDDVLKTEEHCDFAANDMMASSVKEILAEYRFFVVDGKIATYSQYKQGDKLFKSTNVEEGIIDFTKDMITLWQPARAFVIDIAKTPEGLQVIEINNFNSAGFYAADVGKLIDAVEEMQFNV